jgi:hypothetical protein
MNAVSEEQRIIDAEHLRLLRLGYFISGGVTAFFAAFGILYMFMGLVFGTLFGRFPQASGQPPPPEFVGWFFAAIGFAITSLGTTVAVLKLRVARCLRLKTSLTFCMIIAGVSCFEIPYGIVLGVLSFSVLSRPSVKELFGRGVISQDPLVVRPDGA